MKRANAYLVVAIFLLAFCVAVESYDASEIPTDQKRQWCQQQVASCPLICADQGEKNTAEKNICVVRTLEYECVCNNGFQPNASEYTQTIPYFTCTQDVEDCKENCNSDANCIDGCNRECGVKNPPKREEEEGDTAGNDDEGSVIEDGEPTETDDDSGEDDDTDLYADSEAALTSINGSFVIFLAVALAFSVCL